MKDIQKLKLIDGEFSAAEAKEVLMNVFSSKIQFHKMKNFGSQERFGKEDATAVKRIPELRKSMEEILNIIAEAEENMNVLVIKSDVNIRFSKKKSKAGIKKVLQ